MELTKEQAMRRIEDAVWQALEAGMTPWEVQNEVDLAIGDFEDDHG